MNSRERPDLAAPACHAGRAVKSLTPYTDDPLAEVLPACLSTRSNLRGWGYGPS